MSLPIEGISCRCDARDGLHVHSGDEIFPLILDARVPRGTFLFGVDLAEPTAMSVDDALVTAWGLSADELEVGMVMTKPRKPEPEPSTCSQCGAANPGDPCSTCGARIGG